MAQTSSCETISTRQQKLAKRASEDPQQVVSTLAHHIDLMWPEEAYRGTRKDGAVGVDGVTAAHYEEQLQANLRDLLERFKSGLYRAPPLRRPPIPKEETKKTRPIGISTLEDKVLQRAVLMFSDGGWVIDLDCRISPCTKCSTAGSSRRSNRVCGESPSQSASH